MQLIEENIMSEYKVKYNRHEYRTEYLRSDEWKALRNQVMNLHCVCECCGDKATDVHHMVYRNLVDIKVTDLLPVCRECHNLKHKAIDDKYIPKDGDVDLIKTITKGILYDEVYKEYASWLRTKHHIPNNLINRIKNSQIFVMKKISGFTKSNIWYKDLENIKLTGRQQERIIRECESSEYRRKNKIGDKGGKNLHIIDNRNNRGLFQHRKGYK